MAGKSSEQRTGTRDATYDLISVLYHALQGVETCEQYCRDAEQSGDQELSQFFRDVQENYRSHAERAKNLLGTRMMGREAATSQGKRGSQERAAGSTTNAQVKSGGNRNDDVVDEESKESFPASDAPGHY
jgi:rubrerythrin